MVVQQPSKRRFLVSTNVISTQQY